MNIKGIGNGTSSGMPLEKVKKGESNVPDFQRLLQNAHSTLKEPSQNNAASVPAGKEEILLPPALSIPSSNFLQDLESLSQCSPGLKATEKALDLLEQYQKAMADPRISLKEINPLIQSLSREVEDITQLARKLSPADPLQKIISEIGILSTVEIEKFNRGDYI